MFVERIDGCRGGWVAFKVELASMSSSIQPINLDSIFREQPDVSVTCEPYFYAQFCRPVQIVRSLPMRQVPRTTPDYCGELL